jgi:hypothetical protein
MRAVILGGAWLAMLAASPLSLAETGNLEVAGLVEVASATTEDFAGAGTDTVSLATVELALDMKINERVDAFVGFLYEEGATDFGLDEGTITLALLEGASLTAGKMYVPFGRFDTFMISDPQTLVMGETTESVLMFSMGRAGLYGSVYLFNGDSNRASEVSAGNDTGLSAGVNLGYARDDVFNVGISYISNIADSNTLQGLTTTGTAVGVVERSVAGASAFFSATFGRFTVLGEHLSALQSFRNGDLDGTVSRDERPSASNIEVGIAIVDDLTVAAGYQVTCEAQFIGLPETVTSATVAYEVLAGTILAGEYAVMQDYTVADGGTAGRATSLTMQLAVEF